jgi:hypothetical protein
VKTESQADPGLQRSHPGLVEDGRRGRLGSGADLAAALRTRLTQEVVLLLFVLALAVIFGFYESVFWSGVNLQNVSRQGAVLAMVAAG